MRRSLYQTHKRAPGRPPGTIFRVYLILHLPLSFDRRPCDFTGVLDEKLGDRAERAILQGDDSIWNAGHRQFNGQDLQLLPPRRKSQ